MLCAVAVLETEIRGAYPARSAKKLFGPLSYYEWPPPSISAIKCRIGDFWHDNLSTKFQRWMLNCWRWMLVGNYLYNCVTRWNGACTISNQRFLTWQSVNKVFNVECWTVDVECLLESISTIVSLVEKVLLQSGNCWKLKVFETLVNAEVDMVCLLGECSCRTNVELLES